jgi:hypothetical protein
MILEVGSLLCSAIAPRSGSGRGPACSFPGAAICCNSPSPLVCRKGVLAEWFPVVVRRGCCAWYMDGCCRCLLSRTGSVQVSAGRDGTLMPVYIVYGSSALFKYQSNGKSPSIDTEANDSLLSLPWKARDRWEEHAIDKWAVGISCRPLPREFQACGEAPPKAPSVVSS